MATRGVFQLTKLRLNYCEFSGSSATVREYIGNGPLVAWARKNENVAIEVVVRNGKHPYLEAEYQSNTTQHQICLKNKADAKAVEKVFDTLRNRSGRKISKITQPIKTSTPSIQGVWTPFLNLQNEPKFKVQLMGSNSGKSDME